MGISGILINILILRFYSIENLGLFNEAYAFFIVLSQFGAGGIHLSILRYIPVYRENTSEQKKILLTAEIICIMINIVLLTIFFLTIPFISSLYGQPKLESGLYLIIPAVFFISLNKILMAYINGKNMMKAFAIFQAMRFILMLFVLIMLRYLSIEGEYLSLIFSLSEATLFLLLLITLYKDVFFPGINYNELKYWIKAHFQFGKNAVLGNIVTDLNTRVDVLVLGLFCSQTLIGVYTFAATLAEGFQQLPVVLRNFYNARIVHFIVKNNDSLLNKILKIIKKKSYLIVLPLGVLGILLYPVLLMIIKVDIPLVSSWIVFSVLAIGIMVAGGYIPLQFLLNHAGLPFRQTQLLFILFLINVVLNFILIPYIGIIGAAIATAFSTISLIPILKFFSKKFLHIHV